MQKPLSAAPRHPESREAFDARLRRQAGCRRRLVIVGVLWVMAWSTAALNGLIQYTDFEAGLPGFLLFHLVLSPVYLIPMAVLAMIGRLLGGIRPWHRYRYHLAIGVPLLAGIAVQVPTLMDRVRPERVLARMIEQPPPPGVRIVNSKSTHYGLDNSLEFTLRGSDAGWDVLIGMLGHEVKRGSHPERYTDNPTGCLSVLEVDRASGTATLSFEWY